MDQPADKTPRRVTILNQYYVPDVAATGQLLHTLARELVALGCDVEVLTSKPNYGPKESRQQCPWRQTLDGVRVRRLWTTRFGKDRMLGRLLNILTFLVQLSIRMIFSRGDRVYLYVTNPPFLGAIGAAVATLRKHRYVMLLHDAYPQIVVWMNKTRPDGLVARLWHRTNRAAYNRAEQTIVLCQKARKLVIDTYNVDPDTVHVIPNWADGDLIQPKPKAHSELARELGLVEPFVVQYSGNLGLYYDFETILGAAEALGDQPFRLLLIGSGGKKAWLAEQIKQRGLTNTLLLGYQPYEKLGDSLAACDAALVSIARGIEGISFPSKLYTALATGRPILALAEADSELRDLVEQHDVGKWVAVGDVDGCAAAIREMMADAQQNAERGRRSRALYEQRYTKQQAGQRYAKVLAAAMGRPIDKPRAAIDPQARPDA